MLSSRKQPQAREVAVQRPRPMVVELNFLPDRYRGRGLRILTSLRPWLFLVGFVLLLIPTVKLFRMQTMHLAAVEAEYATVSAALAGYQPLADERALLEGRIESAEVQILDIQAAFDTIDIRDVTWSEMVPLILAQVPEGVELTLVNQSDEEVVLEGLAESYPLPSLLADNLEAMGEFELVSIQSIVLVEPEVQPAVVEPVTPSEVDAEQPPGEEEEAAADEPIGAIEAEALSPDIMQGRVFPLYRFRISVFLPLPFELAPEAVDES